jgi:hypothetical protein
MRANLGQGKPSYCPTTHMGGHQPLTSIAHARRGETLATFIGTRVKQAIQRGKGAQIERGKLKAESRKQRAQNKWPNI